jgi:predicted ArsR family transcriptional regulator
MLEHLACHGPATAVELSETAHTARNYAHSLMRNVLLAAGVVHITAWRINGRGEPSPIYAIGPGKSKRRPRAETPAQRAARRRKSLVELYGNDIANSVLNRGRSTHIVIDGQRVRSGSHQSQIAGKIVRLR